MTAFDDAFRPLAVELIGKFGRAATLRRKTVTAIPATGGSTTTLQDHTSDNTGNTLKVSPLIPFKVFLVNGTSVRQTETQVYLAAKTAPIIPGAVSTTANVTFLDQVILVPKFIRSWGSSPLIAAS